MKTGMRIIREFYTNLARYMGIFLLVIVAIGIMSAFMCSADSIEATITNMNEENCVEDGSFRVMSELKESWIEELEELGISIELEAYTEKIIKEEQKIRIFQKRDKINTISIVEGRSIEKVGEIVIDPLFAEENGYAVGDEIEIGKEVYTITGFGAVPEYIYILEQYTSSNVDAAVFGIGFVTKEVFETYEKEELSLNYSFVGEMNILKEYLEEKQIEYSLMERVNNPRISGISSKLDTDKKMGMMIGFLVIVIIAFLLGIMGKKKVQEECKEIGTLYAIGYFKKELIANYIALPTAITILGSVLGWVMGVFGITKSLVAASYGFYCIPKLILSVKPMCVIIAVIYPFILVLVINYVILNKALNVKPLRMLRNDLKKEKAREYNLVHGRFSTRFKIRVFLCEIGNYLILIAGIILAVFMLVMGLGMYDSIRNYVSEVEDTILCENMYLLKAPIEVEEDCEKIYLKSLDCYFEIGEEDMAVTIMGLPRESSYFDKKIKDLKENEIIISDATAKKFKLKKDEIIVLKDSVEEEYKLKIVEIVPYATGLYAFMERENLNQLLGQEESTFNGYLSEQELSIESMYLNSVVTRESLMEAARNYFDMMSATVLMLIAGGIIIFLVLLFLLLKLVIERNVADISLVKILGYLPKEIKSLYFGATFWVLLFGLVIAVPLDKVLMCEMWPVLNASFRGFMDFELSMFSAILCVILGVVAYFFIYLFLNKKIDHISMVEVLKGRE